MTFTKVSDAAAPVVDGATRLYAEHTIRQYLDAAVETADLAGMRPELGEALCAALETVCAGDPEVPFGTGIREDAAWWADMAAPIEIEAYVAAGLRAMENKVFAARARKRIFVVLWEAMTPEDRRKFLSRVDPDGQFIRGAA